MTAIAWQTAATGIEAAMAPHGPVVSSTWGDHREIWLRLAWVDRTAADQASIAADARARHGVVLDDEPGCLRAGWLVAQLPEPPARKRRRRGRPPRGDQAKHQGGEQK